MTPNEPGGSVRLPDHDPGRAPSARAALARVLERLEETVNAETAALEAGSDVDFDDFNRRKGHGLLELTKLARMLPPEARGREIGQRVAALRLSLLKNRSILQIHLNAAEEIARVLTSAMGEAESDGTYAPTAATGGAR